MRDSAEFGACAACDSVRGERKPRRARKRRSDERSVPRAQLQRWRRKAPTRRRRWRRVAFGRRSHRRSDSLSIRSSSVRAFINPVVVNQVIVGKSRRTPAARARQECRDHKNAEFCFARRLRAKVSWFPLADRLAERTRACRTPANDHLLSNLYHGHMALSSASRFRDSNQPDAAPCRRDSLNSCKCS